MDRLGIRSACSASGAPDRTVLVDEARWFGRCLAAGGHRLVRGAGDRGLTGEAARAMQDAGGRILGLIPKHLPQRVISDGRAERGKPGPAAGLR